jgi:hypothetical protein
MCLELAEQPVDFDSSLRSQLMLLRFGATLRALETDAELLPHALDVTPEQLDLGS